MWEPITVAMERDYLKAWAIFDKEVDKIKPKLYNSIRQSENDLEGQLHALYALSACKLEAPELKWQMLDNIGKLLGQDD